MSADILAELRAECEYDPEGDSPVDALIAYKDALEDRVYAAASRIAADIVFHQAAQATAQDPTVYDPEGEVSESYHSGRVEAMTDAHALIAGQERTLYSETKAPA